MCKQNIPKIYILILNWNGWKDTVECLESVFRSEYDNYQVIVCDNKSSDNSLEYIKKWADGLYELEIDDGNDLKNLVYPYVKKPIPYIEYNREQAENGPFNEGENTSLILIQTGANLGFAGGNNVGLRYALAKNDFDYVCLLNNDTIVKEDFLINMIRTAENDKFAGIIGGKIYYFDQPQKIWFLGGSINHFTGKTKHLKVNKIDNQKYINIFETEYIVGCLMLIKRQVFEDIGLFDENYFLYYEDTDFCVRTKQKGYKLLVNPNSIIYHKVSCSTKNISDAVSYYYNRNVYYFIIKNYNIFNKIFMYIYFRIKTLLKLIVSIIKFDRNKRNIIQRIYNDIRNKCMEEFKL